MRREKDLRIEAEGRDQGKIFRLTEMECQDGDRWANRALLLIARSGVEVTNLRTRAGMLGLFAAGLRSLPLIDHREVEPLFEELMRCVQIVPPNGNPRALLRSGPKGDSDIEEVATLWTIRGELFELHMGFSIAGLLSPQSTSATTSPAGSDAQT